MFGAIPVTASASSPYRIGPSRRASTSSRVQRSPTRDRARSRGAMGMAALCPGRPGPRVTCSSQVARRTAMTALDELQQAVATVAERLDAATVAVGRDRRGSGVVIAAGHILTCAHNLRDRTTEVTFADGRQAQGEVIGVDADGDLAVLAVDTADVAPAEWAPDADATAPGQAVFGVARADGLRVTFGLVSSTGRTFRGPRGRRIGGSIEHTAPLARGATGGPLADTAGRVLGIN